MRFLDRLFGDREPSAKREQREAEEAVMHPREAPVSESEIGKVKSFAAVLCSPKREGELPRLERDWEIVKIDDQTGEVTVRKEGEGEKTLSHEQFWTLNFLKSGEMLDELEAARKKVAGRKRMGDKKVEREREEKLAHFNQIKEAFKAGDLTPMREFFAEPLARLKREAIEAGESRKRQKKELASDIEAQDGYLQRLAEQLAKEKDRKRKILLQNEIDKVNDWGKSLSAKLSKLNSDPLPVNPDLERLKGIVTILDQEIDARGDRVAA